MQNSNASPDTYNMMYSIFSYSLAQARVSKTMAA